MAFAGNMAIGTRTYQGYEAGGTISPMGQFYDPQQKPREKKAHVEEYEDTCETQVIWKHLKRIKNLNEKGGENNRMNRMPRLFRYAYYALPLIVLYYIAFHLQPFFNFIIKVFFNK